MSHEEADRVELRDHGDRSKACTHYGSMKHNDRGCWKLLTCHKCGRKASIGQVFLRVCSLLKCAREWQMPFGKVLQYDAQVICAH